MSHVTIDKVRKRFGNMEILHGVHVDAQDGEFVVLVGPSGCGKSTLLRMIAGLEDIDDGEIRIGGRVINEVQAKDRDIAMVFQNYALYPHMTVGENMGFSMRLRGAPATEIQARVNEAARILGLERLLDRQPRQLSGGQRQRVAMGRAIVRKPQVFLFDEPLSNLDAKMRVQMRAEIKALHQRLRTTTLYVTHDQVEAMTMADKVVVMHEGRVEQIGPPLELYDRPANLFVAQFIGSPAMNVLTGGVVTEAGATTLVTADDVRVPLRARVADTAGSRISVGFRPEHLHFDDAGIPAQIMVVEPTGSETQVLMRANQTDLVGLFRDRFAAKPGDVVRVMPDDSLTHYFDASSGRRLSMQA